MLVVRLSSYSSLGFAALDRSLLVAASQYVPWVDNQPTTLVEGLEVEALASIASEFIFPTRKLFEGQSIISMKR